MYPSTEGPGKGAFSGARDTVRGHVRQGKRAKADVCQLRPFRQQASLAFRIVAVTCRLLKTTMSLRIFAPRLRSAACNDVI